MSSGDYPTLEERAAARKLLEHDHAGQTLDGPAGDAADRNASDIDDEHPRARDIAMTGTARELGEIPKHLKAHQATLRKQAGINAENAARIRAAYRAAPPEHHPQPEGESVSRAPVKRPTSRSSRTSSKRSSGRSAASYGSGVLDTIAPAASGWGALLAEVFAWGIGISLLVVVLNRASNVANITDGVANVVKGIAGARTDPLNYHPKPKPGPRKQPTVHLNVSPIPAGARPRALNALTTAVLNGP